MYSRSSKIECKQLIELLNKAGMNKISIIYCKDDGACLIVARKIQSFITLSRVRKLKHLVWLWTENKVSMGGVAEHREKDITDSNQSCFASSSHCTMTARVPLVWQPVARSFLLRSAPESWQQPSPHQLYARIPEICWSLTNEADVILRCFQNKLRVASYSGRTI